MPQKVAASKMPITTDPYFHDGCQPTWEIAYLFPAQGAWTEDDYWALEGSFGSFRRVELSSGSLDVLPMPTELHQLIMVYLLKTLELFVKAQAPGLVLPSGLKVRLKKGHFREPDVVYLKAENFSRRHEKYWDGADLVMEVVSPDPKDSERDWEIKPREYARAGIPEYWIVDPDKRIVRVLTLHRRSYKVHGDFGPGSRATSVLLPGFAVAVDEALAPPGSELAE